MRVRVVVSGRDYHRADAIPDELELGPEANVNDALARLRDHLPDDSALPQSCLVAVAGNHLGTIGQHTNCQLHDGDELMIIKPVAGG